MSVTDAQGAKILLHRGGPDDFWLALHRRYPKEDERSWKYLAMLALRENAGWPLERIGHAFNHPKGHVTRCLSQIKSELRDVLGGTDFNVDALSMWPDESHAD